jgi:hypothetical protein
VLELHRLLNEKLVPHPGLEEWCDFFGLDTEDAVIQFQTQKGLEPDGIVGRRTWEALRQPDPAKGKPDAGPSINYARTGMVPIAPNGERVLREILTAAGEKSCTVTSTLRTAEEQARIMYDNIKQHGTESQYKLYGSGGDRIVKVFDDNQDKSREDVIKLMHAEIERTQWGASTGHRAHGKDRDTFDVAPSSIKDDRAFHRAIKAHREVGTYHRAKVVGGSDPAFHLEIFFDSQTRRTGQKQQKKTASKSKKKKK